MGAHKVSETEEVDVGEGGHEGAFAVLAAAANERENSLWFAAMR